MLQGDLFKLLESTSDAAFTTTATGEIRSWNGAAERLFGYPASRALNNFCGDLLQGRGILGTAVCPAHCRLAVSGQSIPHFDLEVQTSTGQQAWVGVSTLLFEDSRTRDRLVIHLAHDITASKRAEDLVRLMQQSAKQILALSEGLGKPGPSIPLSKKELQVLRLFSQGKDSSGVAHELGITLQTLRNHLHHINQKLSTHSRVEALTHALKRKIL